MVKTISLNRTRGKSTQYQKSFFTKENYPQKVDTDEAIRVLDTNAIDRVKFY